MPREIDLDGRPFAQLAVDPDMAAGLPDKAINLAQAQARSLSDLLRCEERLEYSADCRLVHTAPGVRDGDLDVLTGRNRFRNVGHVGLVEMCVRGLDR